MGSLGRRLMTPVSRRSAAPYDWVVVGAGPCGIMSAAVLLRRGQRVAWVDPDFSAVGRLGNRYRRVPGNTKVGRLLEGFRSLPAFRFDEDQSRRRQAGHQVLSDIDPEHTCELDLCVQALADGTVALLQEPQVLGVPGTVPALYGEAGEPWRLDVDAGTHVDSIEAENVLLCTGAVPRTGTLQADVACEVVAHDDVVAPDRLLELFCRRPELQAASWGIVGGSHSGMLAAMNLVDAGVQQISVYCSRDLRFAEPRDGWVKWDGSGLKGRVAEWARNLPQQVNLRGRWPQEVTGSVPNVLAYCTGFQRAPMPACTYDGSSLVLDNKAYDRTCGAIDGVPRLYGAGLGFMQEYTDPEGHVETRVGFVPFFIEHVERIVDSSIRFAGETILVKCPTAQESRPWLCPWP